MWNLTDQFIRMKFLPVLHSKWVWNWLNWPWAIFWIFIEVNHFISLDLTVVFRQFWSTLSMRSPPQMYGETNLLVEFNKDTRDMNTKIHTIHLNKNSLTRKLFRFNWMDNIYLWKIYFLVESSPLGIYLCVCIVFYFILIWIEISRDTGRHSYDMWTTKL